MQHETPEQSQSPAGGTAPLPMTSNRVKVHSEDGRRQIGATKVWRWERELAGEEQGATGVQGA